jgi:hypothetical protein
MTFKEGIEKEIIEELKKCASEIFLSNEESISQC